ncbi:MAG: sugar phosphate isomerase/epimerase [Caulobacteraceae bacterium]|nr:sugar phosphate isomerase/epimerase [Caulobacteraceae bacterium]
MSKLLVYQSLWATEQRIPDTPERSYEERFDEVKAAGFDGMSVDLGALPLEQARGVIPEFGRTDLRGLVTAFPRSIEDIRPAIRFAREIGAPFLVVVGSVMPVTIAGMIPVVRAWLAIAEQEGLPLHFETHRHCITNDLYITLQLLDAIPELELSADLSHYAVDRELYLPLSAQEKSHFNRVIERSSSFQGRVASGQQIQLPLHFPQTARWLELFKSWWADGFRQWRARRPESEDLVFLCELGPREYAITDGEGRELSDRWAEAQRLRRIALELWDASA